HFHVVANTAMAILFFRSTIELQINSVEPSGLRLNRKVWVLSKANSVRRNVNAMEALALCMTDCIEEYRGERCLSAREQNINFPLRLEGHSACKESTHIFHIQFMHEN